MNEPFRLGTGDYSAMISARNGAIAWQGTDDVFDSLAFERDWCDTSTATIVFPLRGEVGNTIEPWQHQLTLYRNDELVWQGLVVMTTAKNRMLTVQAFDPSVLFDRRRIGQPRQYRNRDASQVMRDLVVDSFGVDDPAQTVDSISVTNSLIWVTTEFKASERMVADEVKDLVGSGLSWTVAAGRLIIGPGPGTYTTQLLTDVHIDADITVTKNGKDTITDVLVKGKGVYGYSADRATPTGTLQAIHKADSLVRAEECVQAGKRIVDESKYPPRTMTFPSGSRLLPDAPIRLDELIPGVLIPVSSDQSGIRVASVMALKSVKVSVDAGKENVSITLMEVPSSTNTSVMPPPVEEDYSSPWDKERRQKEQQSTSASKTGEGDPEGAVPPA